MPLLFSVFATRGCCFRSWRTTYIGATWRRSQRATLVYVRVWSHISQLHWITRASGFFPRQFSRPFFCVLLNIDDGTPGGHCLGSIAIRRARRVPHTACVQRVHVCQRICAYETRSRTVLLTLRQQRHVSGLLSGCTGCRFGLPSLVNYNLDTYAMLTGDEVGELRAVITGEYCNAIQKNGNRSTKARCLFENVLFVISNRYG